MLIIIVGDISKISIDSSVVCYKKYDRARISGPAIGIDHLPALSSASIKAVTSSIVKPE